MNNLLLVIGLIFVLILISEYLWRIKKTNTELTRKFIHMSVGIVIAFCPYILSWIQLGILAALFLIVVFAARTAKLFGSIHKIDRKSYGDLFFAAAILIVMAITHDKLIFSIAILHLGLADGLAAVVGTSYGKKSRYKVLNQAKSVAGSLAFYLCSLILIVFFLLASHDHGAWLAVIWLPVAATIFENVSVYGFDNITVPVLVALSLRAIS